MHRKASTTFFYVEDDDADVLAFKRELKKQGISNQFVRAQDGIDALEMIQGQQITFPILMIVDMNMPRLNGLGLLKTLHKEKKHLFPSYILSTSQLEKNSFDYDKLNVKGYYTKGDKKSGTEGLLNQVSSALNTRSILIIDDDEADCMHLKRTMLQADNLITLTTIHTIKEGLAELESQQYTHLFLDQYLPDGKGSEVYSSIKESHPNLAITLMSGLDDNIELDEKININRLDKNKLNPEHLFAQSIVP